MTSRVRSASLPVSTPVISCSVTVSRLAATSSSRSTRPAWANARARPIRCDSPPDIGACASGVRYPSGMRRMKASAWAARAAATTASSDGRRGPNAIASSSVSPINAGRSNA